ncbi:response regulator transcription factor [Nevskia sp.]|uniref:response regulator n=1 Tax=Nevskia sp. TaxID=1929292 RepID=UPI0025F46886|nr:response regulator transcription factor [Nevskia sp.]
MRLVLADPQPLVRAGIRRLCEAIPGHEVLAETGDGQQLLELVARQQPELALIELTLPTLNGIDALQQIRRHYPSTMVMILSARSEASQVRAALKAGAVGYLSKQGEAVELDLALRAVAKRQTYLSPSISHTIVGTRKSARAEDSIVLPRRQQQVLQLIARGKSTKEIAQLMGISTKTVETHRARMMDTLGLYGTNALMRYAIRTGLEGAES